MSRLNLRVLFFAAVLFVAGGCATDEQNRYEAVPFTNVHIADDFWSESIETNRTVTIPFAFKKCEETGRISNFARAGGLETGGFQGTYYNDSDVYKIIEGAAYSLSTHPDPELQQYVDGIIDKIAAAQWPDGYVYTFYSLDDEAVKRQPWKRWTDRGCHELYCAGHYFEAAEAYYRSTGNAKALNVAVKWANYIDQVFAGDGSRNFTTPGHQEIEMALARLYLLTSEEKYLHRAKFFLDMRGKGMDPPKTVGTYCQDHKPVTEQGEAVGHAVRAGYMYCGMADVAALTGDQKYVQAIDRIWDNIVGKKLYLTGGIGASHKGEAFSGNYELPNKEAYCETCAAIANAMFNHRLWKLHGHAKYIDVLERILYNGSISGVSLDGEKFFYPNPLASDGGYARSEWFHTSCCPTNISRFIPSMPGYFYGKSGSDIYVNLFATGTGTIETDTGKVVLRQKTDYPWDGLVRITVEPQQSCHFVMIIRIPGWAQGKPVPSDLYRYANDTQADWQLTVNGQPANAPLEKGYVRIKRKWQPGDVIELNLPMPVKRVLCNEVVKANRGRVALERGPIVYCAETVDNQIPVSAICVSDNTVFETEYNKDLLDGIVVITGKDGKDNTKIFKTIPYYAWAHRNPGPMAVWLKRK